jgi:hypothetical protein
MYFIITIIIIIMLNDYIPLLDFGRFFFSFLILYTDGRTLRWRSARRKTAIYEHRGSHASSGIRNVDCSF